MKIIAKNGSCSFLAEISAAEIDSLAGKMVGRWSEDYCRTDRKIEMGTTINIPAVFAQIHRNDQRKREVESLRATLNAIIVGLDMIEPLIEEPKPEEQEAEVA